MKAPRWLVPFALAALLGWWISRPTGPSFVRLPGAGHPAPAWRMTNLSGTVMSSSDLAGRIVVLNFWATWCPPCRRELPELEAFHGQHGHQGIVVVGGATDQEG
ncbi:MAG: TlpA family protein disulfide reductase, partial [Verrucomicrobia bacterium]|nr:TlpA family protein disulfide reductase [Verrucomicrobiota bacterium]